MKGSSSQRSEKKFRACGYCRTSGEGQRDNTSIPRQKEAIEEYCRHQGFDFVEHYIDESKSGAKVQGREAYQRMIRDAATQRFDLVVVFDITRLARDGAEIISCAKFLEMTFGIHVVDSKGTFDTRDKRQSLLRFVHAGVSEHERISIMDRMIGARVRNAQQGLPWCKYYPQGREFKRTGKHSGEWVVSEKGRKLAELLKRYADGEPLRALGKEYGYKSTQIILFSVRKSQLSGPYVARFNSPDIGIENLEITVPGMPEVISPELEQRIKARMAQNQRWNRQETKKYLFSGFLRCARCGTALCGHSPKGIRQYKHCHPLPPEAENCEYRVVNADLLEKQVMDYLYSTFLDRPTFNEAVSRSVPTDENRREVENELVDVKRRIAEVEKSIANLVEAIAAGANPALLISKQDQLTGQRVQLREQQSAIEERLHSMPSRKSLETTANLLRTALACEIKDRDWTKLSFDSIRRFLTFLFGENPRADGFGIFVDRIGASWTVTFKGRVPFMGELLDGIAVKGRNRRIIYKRATAEIGREIQQYLSEKGLWPPPTIKPSIRPSIPSMTREEAAARDLVSSTR